MVIAMSKEHKPTYFSPAIQLLGGKETVILRFCDISDISDVDEDMKFNAELFKVAITKSSAETLFKALKDYLDDGNQNES